MGKLAGGIQNRLYQLHCVCLVRCGMHHSNPGNAYEMQQHLSLPACRRLWSNDAVSAPPRTEPGIATPCAGATHQAQAWVPRLHLSKHAKDLAVHKGCRLSDRTMSVALPLATVVYNPCLQG